MNAWASSTPRGIRRRQLMKFGAAVGLAGLPAMPLRAAPVARKIALEEHFTSPELEQQGLVAKPTSNDAIFSDMERRLKDFGELRLGGLGWGRGELTGGVGK